MKIRKGTNTITPRGSGLAVRMAKAWQLYLFMLIPLLYYAVFQYAPMYGIQIAFKNFSGSLGILGSPWVGFANFTRFFNSYQFVLLIKNTLLLSFLTLICGFPIPIILALLLNQVGNKKFKKVVQTVTYAPYFLSTVVLVGMVFVFLAPRGGIINNIIHIFGGQSVFFMGDPGWFRPLYIITDIWQQSGWASIIYIAALAGISPELHEAAIVDGASRLRRIWHIDIPGILPTIVIMLIMRSGSLMSVGFDKAYLMQTSLNLDASEIISTYVYKVGLTANTQFSFAAAVGLFNSVINLILIATVNQIAKKVGETSLW